jgi:hypothetical protein
VTEGRAGDPLEPRLREHYRAVPGAPAGLAEATRAAVRAKSGRRSLRWAPLRDTLQTIGAVSAAVVIVVGVVIGIGLTRSSLPVGPVSPSPASSDGPPTTGLATPTAPAVTPTPQEARVGDIRRATASFVMGGGGEGRVHVGELLYLAAGPEDRDGALSLLVQHWGDVHGEGVYPPTRFAWVPADLLAESTVAHEPTCPAPGPAVKPVAMLQPFERFLCYGDGSLSFGPVRTMDVFSGGVTATGWLSDDARGDWVESLPYELLEGVSPALQLDRWVVVTGRFDDPTSSACGDAEAVTRCRERFVITEAREVDEPDFVARGAWRRMADPPRGGRSGHAMAWTGTEMFVWGGSETRGDATVFDPLEPREGLLYDPTTDRWRVTAPAPVDPVNDPILAWTGSEVLVIGGSRAFVALAYDPAADSWRSLPAAPAELGGPAVGGWLRDSLVVVTDQAAAIYRPADDSWVSLPPAPIRPSWRVAAVAADRLVVIAFGDGATPPVEGATFDPSTGTWRPFEVPLDPLSAGSAVIGIGDDMHVPGAMTAYDPIRDTWRPTVRCAEAGVGGVWTGRVLQGVYGQYDPATDECRQMPEPPPRGAPFEETVGREFPVAVWTGREYLTWSGGTGGDIVVIPNDGAIFRPDLP